jgi:hypothetical protein
LNAALRAAKGRAILQLPEAASQKLPSRGGYDALMRSRDTIEILADSGVDALGPTVWADPSRE